MVFHFATLSIKERFRGSYLGILWTALEPMLVFILLYVVFTSIRYRPQEDFTIYLLTSIILYHIFTRGTLSGLSSIRGSHNIIKTIKIPIEFFPVVSATATGMLVIVQIGVFFGLMPFFQFIPTWTVIYLPIVVGLILLLTLGINYILSIIFVFTKDIQPFWGIAVHALFFLSPIMWYVQDANEFLQWVQMFNPVGQILELGHNVVVFGTVPPLNDWLYTGIFVAIIFFTGYALLKKFETKVAEEL